MEVQYRGAFGPITVRDEAGFRRLYLGDVYQGGMLLGAPQECTSTVFRSFLHIADLRPVPERVMVIGLGAGEIPRSFWHAFPRTHIRVAEIDPVITLAAKAHFELPDDERLEVVVGDGVDVLRESPELFDLVVLDVNAGEMGMPAQFRERAFLELVAAKLGPNGMFAANVIGAFTGVHSQHLRRFLLEAERLFPERYRLTFAAARPEQIQNVICFFGRGEQLPAGTIPTPHLMKVTAGA